jgi:hypothetical protein
MILATSETDAPFKLIITLVEAPCRDVSKRSIVEGATMSYADAEDFRLILDSKEADNAPRSLEHAIQSATQRRGSSGSQVFLIYPQKTLPNWGL